MFHMELQRTVCKLFPHALAIFWSLKATRSSWTHGTLWWPMEGTASPIFCFILGVTSGETNHNEQLFYFHLRPLWFHTLLFLRMGNAGKHTSFMMSCPSSLRLLSPLTSPSLALRSLFSFCPGSTESFPLLPSQYKEILFSFFVS